MEVGGVDIWAVSTRGVGAWAFWAVNLRRTRKVKKVLMTYPHRDETERAAGRPPCHPSFSRAKRAARYVPCLASLRAPLAYLARARPPMVWPKWVAPLLETGGWCETMVVAYIIGVSHAALGMLLCARRFPSTSRRTQRKKSGGRRYAREDRDPGVARPPSPPLTLPSLTVLSPCRSR